MEITKEEFKEKIKNGDKFLVDFWASWCGPCKLMKPRFEKAGENSEDVSFFTFDVEKDVEFISSEIGISSVPTIKGFNGGKETYSGVGLMTINQLIDISKNL